MREMGVAARSGLCARWAAAEEAYHRRAACYDLDMPSIKVSSKYQVSIPSVVRRRLGIEAGDRLSVEVSDDGLILRRRAAKPSDRLRGLGREAWQGIDPVEYVRQLRDEAERSLPSPTPAKRG